MPSRRPRMVQRNRSALELRVLHVEITTESYQLLKDLSAAKQIPMGGYVDLWLKRKKEKLVKEGFIQG